MSSQPATTATATVSEPQRGEIWREADGTLLLCYEPGKVWVQIDSMLLVSATDPSLVAPMTLVVDAAGNIVEPTA